MKKLFVRPIVLAVIGGLGVTSLVYAQDRPAPQAPAQPEHGMMKHGDMPGMMARMSKMMDQCEKMMEQRSDRAKRPDRAPQR